MSVSIDRRTGSGGVRYHGGPGAAARARSAPGAPEQGAPEQGAWSDALYSNLTLLAALIEPPGWHGHSGAGGADAIMLSVHVDTQWIAEGASDNTVHVATLLELLSCLVAGCVGVLRAAPQPAR